MTAIKGKVRKLTLIILALGVLAFSPVIYRAWANPDPIDAGPGATDRASTSLNGYTYILLSNPANDTGTIDTVEVWCNTNMTGLKVGTFFLVSDSTYECRAVATIGNVTSGSKQTFSGLSISVEAGDYLGAYWATGWMERDISGGGGYKFRAGDHVNASEQASYTNSTAQELSFYATGDTAPPAAGGGQLIIIGRD